MSCVTFQNELTADQLEMMRDMLGAETAFDGRTALYNGALELDSKKMGDLARANKAPIKVSIHGEGEIKTMRDGTKYLVTARGWQKVEP